MSLFQLSDLFWRWSETLTSLQAKVDYHNVTLLYVVKPELVTLNYSCKLGFEPRMIKACLYDMYAVHVLCGTHFWRPPSRQIIHPARVQPPHFVISLLKWYVPMFLTNGLAFVWGDPSCYSNIFLLLPFLPVWQGACRVSWIFAAVPSFPILDILLVNGKEKTLTLIEQVSYSIWLWWKKRSPKTHDR